MSLRWITLNKKLTEGVKLINLLSNTQFTLLLRRTSESDGNDIVSDEERKKLSEVLNLDESGVNLLLQCLVHVWKQSTKVILKPTDLTQNLTNILSLDTEKAQEYIKIWIEKTKSDCGDLEKRKKLDSIAWEIDLEAASCNSKQLVAKATIQLGLTDFLDSSKIDKITLELSENELLELYSTIEKVQAKLDNMQNISQT